MAFLLGHALYKGALFLVAGALDHETGTRDVDRLGGLGRAMPLTALAAGVAALSMAGLPPLFGFIAKELSYEATLHAPAAGWVTAAAVAANVLLVAVAGLVGLRPFLGKAVPTPRPAHEAPPSLLLGPLVLAGLGVAFGLWPGSGAEWLVSAASTSVLGRPAGVHLALWHGLTPALALSAATLAGGVGVYAGRGLLRRAASRWEGAARWGPAGWYELALKGLNGLAVGQTRLLQSGYLRYYLMITVAATAGLAGYALVGRGALAVAVELVGPALLRSRAGGAHPARDPGGGPAEVAARGHRRPGRRRLRRGAGLRPVRRAGPGDDAVPGRDADRHPVRAGVLPPAGVPDRVRQGGPVAGRRPGGGRRGRHDGPRAGRHPRELPAHLGLLRGAQRPAGPRPERRQRHPGRFPRAGHARRDHGPGGGRRRGVRPAQAAPEGGRRRGRKSRRPGARAGRRGRGRWRNADGEGPAGSGTGPFRPPGPGKENGP